VEGYSSILGTWVPLNDAREFVQTRAFVPDALKAFLSTSLYEDFPSSIHNLYRSHEHLRSLQQLGPPFRSMVERQPSSSIDDTIAQTENDALVPSFPGGAALDTPLSVKEKEIFQTLCACPDWDIPSPSPALELKPKSWQVEERRTPVPQRQPRTTKGSPLRRSKRVAEALASRPRARIGKNRT
jgi:hypothetical protein